MADDDNAARRRSEIDVAKLTVDGRNMAGEVDMIERVMSTVPEATGNNAEKKIAAFRLGDAVLTALCNAKVERVRQWAVSVRAEAVAMTWKELRTRVEEELVDDSEALLWEQGRELSDMSRKQAEPICDYVRRYAAATRAVGTNLHALKKETIVPFIVYCLRDMRDDALQAKVYERLASGEAVEDWSDFVRVLRAQAGMHWSVAPPRPAASGTRRTPRTYASKTAYAISAEERRERRERGLCFKCGEPGIARECPNHGARPSGNGGAGGGQ